MENEGRIGEDVVPPLTRAAVRHWQDAPCSVLSSADIPDFSEDIRGISQWWGVVLGWFPSTLPITLKLDSDQTGSLEPALIS